jgi:hypothetical protein
MNFPAVETDRIPAPLVAASTKMKARLIIPVWGEKYVHRLDSACLPAVLAPGNLPCLSEYFDCELVLVTQAALFDQVRSLRSVRAAQRYCSLKLVAMDDVLSHPNYYGYTITHAFYRGFTDLGDAAKDVWCLFVHADFILADGSYRALVDRIRAGERYILAPSYCTIEENVWPVLEERIASDGGILSIPPRQMAGLILDNRHFTIRSKTINWRMYHIEHVDQFYYVLDNDTLVGRQIPIAVVAFLPERVPPEPVAFWDYGLKSEVCPSHRHCVLGDSDDFLIMELRASRVMGDWLKLGWMDKDEIARQFSTWSTADQRACAPFNLVVHRTDLDGNINRGIQALDDFWNDISRRLTSEPRDYRNHYIWTGLISLHNEWLRTREQMESDGSGDELRDTEGPRAAASDVATKRSLGRLVLDLVKTLTTVPFQHGWGESRRRMYDIMRTGYRSLFGRLPEIGLLDPQWADLRPVLDRIMDLAKERPRGLSLWSAPDAAVAPHLSRWIRQINYFSPEDVFNDKVFDAMNTGEPYDLCFLELTRDELITFGKLHARLRTVMRKGGHILVFYRTRGREHVTARDFQLVSGGLPGCDLPELQFRGGLVRYLLQWLWDSERVRATRGGVIDMLRFAVIAALGGIVAAAANRFAIRRAPGRMPNPCTSLFLQVTVI